MAQSSQALLERVELRQAAAAALDLEADHDAVTVCLRRLDDQVVTLARGRPERPAVLDRPDAAPVARHEHAGGLGGAGLLAGCQVPPSDALAFRARPAVGLRVEQRPEPLRAEVVARLARRPVALEELLPDGRVQVLEPLDVGVAVQIRVVGDARRHVAVPGRPVLAGVGVQAADELAHDPVVPGSARVAGRQRAQRNLAVAAAAHAADADVFVWCGRRPLGQLVPAGELILRALVAQVVVRLEQVGERQLAAVGEPEDLVGAVPVRSLWNPPLHRPVEQRARLGQVGERAPEQDAGEVGFVPGILRRRHEQRVALAAAGAAAVERLEHAAGVGPQVQAEQRLLRWQRPVWNPGVAVDARADLLEDLAQLLAAFGFTIRRAAHSRLVARAARSGWLGGAGARTSRRPAPAARPVRCRPARWPRCAR